MISFEKLNSRIICAVTVSGFFYGSYKSFQESKGYSLEEQLFRTTIGGIYGTFWGAIYGHIWPITISVIVARQIGKG